MNYSPYLLLFFAILCEIFATSSLKASEGFTRVIPGICVFIGYGLSFYLLSLVLKTIPVGVAYAVWCGVGIVLISVTGFILFKQSLDAPALAGIVLITLGVVIIQFFSRSGA